MQTIQDAKILVVDDNRELRNLIKEELTGAGYRAVRMADSAAAARQAISGELPELVILDINLPDGDGFSLFREIQSGTLQQHHQLCRTAGVGIYGCGSCGKTSYKWVLRCFVMYVRTGGMAGLILPVMLCTYVRSIYPCFLPL